LPGLARLAHFHSPDEDRSSLGVFHLSSSIFDIFKTGIGPSSSHTMGPMRAAARFAAEARGDASQVHRLRVELFGSLALTGRGHGTDTAILLGLEGHLPEHIDPDRVAPILDRIRSEGRLRLAGGREIGFDEGSDLLMRGEQRLAPHSNGMRFTATQADGAVVLEREYFSIGGGFILEGGPDARPLDRRPEPLRYPFETAADLLEVGRRTGLSLAEIAMANETTWRSESEVHDGCQRTWAEMDRCIERGLRAVGTLPGGLEVPRRAPGLARELADASARTALDAMDRVNAWAMAVAEENAAGGRVVTAPTNGAAGVIPAVLRYYLECTPAPDDRGVTRFLLTAGSVGILYKKNASLSAAEMGCQGEVGVACSMAAAGLVAARGGSNAQVENAAEIGMEHNLGLTCDPVGGLVQIPCIERNAMGAVKSINASRLALRGDGRHIVSLDQVVATMWETGRDMSRRYKETSQGGLAVNVPDC
jgi:L-serine dehydratase